MQEEEPEVVYGRRLLPKPVKVPFSRLMAKGQRVMEEIVVGLRQEWEELEAERLRLSNWERRLGDRIETVTSRHAEERAQLEQERDDLQEHLQQEAVTAQWERVAVRREAMVIERELAMEERSRVALELTNHAKAALKLIEEQCAALAEREAAVVKGEANLTVHREELATQTQGLQEREASLQEREAKVEEFLAERSASIDRVVRWADEVNPSLDALGLSPIQVAWAPPSLGAILPVLESAAE
jgi:chromosome segregation ATPase